MQCAATMEYTPQTVAYLPYVLIGVIDLHNRPGTFGIAFANHVYLAHLEKGRKPGCHVVSTSVVVQTHQDNLHARPANVIGSPNPLQFQAGLAQI